MAQQTAVRLDFIKGAKKISWISVDNIFS